jgi:DNA mismatch repair protein MutS
MKKEDTLSPMMLQWHACKKAAGTAILLFRMGDFYEAFFEDATLIAKELDLTLTSRQGTAMSGVPYHTCEAYVDKLVSKGYRVAVAEQTSDPKNSKGLLKREVVRVVTPGTLINSSLLADKRNNFFASITRVGNLFGLALLDLTTADFKVGEFESETDLLNEICRSQPAECFISHKFAEKHRALLDEIRHNCSTLVNTEENWRFEHQITCNFLTSHFNVHNLDGFGLKGMIAAINASGALLHYLQDTLCLPIGHIIEVTVYSPGQYMMLDRITEKNLELTRSLQDGGRKNTLLAVLDQTRTPMGARLMHQWVKQPLLNILEIKRRQDSVEGFLKYQEVREKISSMLDQVRDIERLIMKISTNYANPRDLSALRFSMEPLDHIRATLQNTQIAPLILEETAKLDSLPDMTMLIARALVDEPPAKLNDGKIFRDGFHSQLDELREISRDSKSWLASYQTKLREQTNIKTLKLGFTKAFGYYIEISKGQTNRVPDTFHRRQTLVNGERYITPELKEYEQKVLTAEEKISSIEAELFAYLRQEIAKYAPQILKIAQALAKIDCLFALAEAASRFDYIRPKIDESYLLQIVEGRHPVIEASQLGEKFIPNDVSLNDTDHRLLLITGPNMAGKSTYIRQVALLAIMAQIGSFIPAKAAHIGLIDKVFTRIGASDDLSRGQSTFMVEMTETANILNNATNRSLVVLDEIGRGTSTYDGISIAWSVAEYLLSEENRMAKTLFATHYWELTKLEERISGAVNYHVAVHESNDHIIFLRKIVRGGTDKSYGLHVGRLAGLPQVVVERAKEILVHLEENANRKNVFEPSQSKKRPKQKNKTNEFQLSFFESL